MELELDELLNDESGVQYLRDDIGAMADEYTLDSGIGSYRDNDQCVCGAQETVTHVLVDCLNLREIRRKLRNEAGDAFNSVSSLPGGLTEGERGNPDTVSRVRTVQAVLDFAEASQRFRSRAPLGQPNNGSGNKTTAGLDEPLSSFPGSGSFSMYVLCNKILGI
ncbi:uncharacterized protein N7529_001785 [Penicillium soppii]|uniref:uncharacterized protein n=1 Tax=Penicillium soppii TaxID=69789 RepID=UPI0025466FFF|nr:uncharacterized protein N7529_001785 [Penicillium soppii]KAJ5876201.1 hypothetical protein N7529_001785 [Penicillium soppii]